ncbi:MAG: response regulator [Pseudomonadota bacterium]
MIRKIMIVDDDVTITTELEEFLFSRGYQVVGTTFSGDEAIEMAAKLRPDLILMDIDMPGKTDGITAAEEIRSSLDIPVLFLTGRSEGEVIERAKRAEPLGYIMKPFNEKQIDAAVQIALNKKDADQGRKVIQSELEEMVKERTAELAEANRKLRQEIDERKKNEQALRARRNTEPSLKASRRATMSLI